MALFTTKDTIDPKNNPSEVSINNVLLPPDTLIMINGEKVIAESKILDGVSVFERISRKPYEINLDFTVRQQNSEISTLLPDQGKYIFPQDKLEYYFQQIWTPNSIAVIKNTLLNGLGINEVAIKSINLTPIRGNTNVLGTIKCLENFNYNDSTTLVIPV